jgi:molecular chaperone DnaK
VTFDIDANGIVRCRPRIRPRASSSPFRLRLVQRLSKEEIDNLVKDAELHADEDKKKKELVEARNHAELKNP